MSFPFFGFGNTNGANINDQVPSINHPPANTNGATINGQFPSLNLLLATLNHDRRSNQSIAANQTNETVHLGNMLGQLGLSSRVSGFQTTLLSQTRMRVQCVLDCEILATTPQPLPHVPLNGFTTYGETRLSRSNLLEALATMRRANAVANNGFSGISQSQPLAGNMYQAPEAPNDHVFSIQQNPSRSQPPVFQTNPDEIGAKSNDGVIACDPISFRLPEPEPDAEVMSKPSSSSKQRKRKYGSGLKDNQVRANAPKSNVDVTNPAPASQVEPQNNLEPDNRKKRIVFKMNGPYKCKICPNTEFDTSQRIAAHMRNHYRSESKEETMARHALRGKRKMKNPLVETSPALTTDAPSKEIEASGSLNTDEPRSMDKAVIPVIVIKDEPIDMQ